MAAGPTQDSKIPSSSHGVAGRGRRGAKLLGQDNAEKVVIVSGSSRLLWPQEQRAEAQWARRRRASAPTRTTSCECGREFLLIRAGGQLRDSWLQGRGAASWLCALAGFEVRSAARCSALSRGVDGHDVCTESDFSVFFLGDLCNAAWG